MSVKSTHNDTYSASDEAPEQDHKHRPRKIIHVDMDAFYASVEQRDDATLQGRPVIVGGKPNGRGVVAACSYEAREFGIRSAMPSAEAGRRCPHAAFVKPRFTAYKQASTQIHAVFREFTPHIEPLSLDEAYLDVTDNTLFSGSAVRLAREIKSLIWERTNLVASAGVSYNKFLAKIASDYDKPDGLFYILPEHGEDFVAGLAVGRFHGVGKVTEARMHDLGIHTGADLRQWTEEELSREFGKSASYYFNVARGIDHRPVRNSRTRKSMGSERTFADNIQQRQEMLQVIEGLTDELMDALADKSLSCSTITIKVRNAAFTTVTRAHSQAAGVLNRDVAKRSLPFLLDRALLGLSHSSQHVGTRGQRRGSGIRLLGVSLGSLSSRDGLAPTQLEIDWD